MIYANTVAHPDTLNIAPDCRRVLRDAYQSIQVAGDKDRLIKDDGDHWVEAPNMPGGGYYARNVSPRTRTTAEINAAVARAIAAYREIAALWKVDVG